MPPIAMDAISQELSCAAVSPRHPVVLVELFTSEGCSSCPPAERWMSKQWPTVKFEQTIPLAWHVSYWDYLGWKDPYASESYTQRQRDYATARNSNTVYTPQVVVQGRDDRNWYLGAIKPANTQAEAAVKLQVSAKGNTQRITAYVQADALRGRLDPDVQVHMAVTYSGLVSKVLRGENAGTTLRHDHVVRAYSGPQKLNSANGRALTALELPAVQGAVMRNLVVWLEKRPGQLMQASGCELVAAAR
jgi:hypothetical protein